MKLRFSWRLVRVAALVALVGCAAVAMPTMATDRVITVRSGDTLSQIALSHGVTVAQLLAWNAIANPKPHRTR